jgi:hypothetical protein
LFASTANVDPAWEYCTTESSVNYQGVGVAGFEGVH